VTPPRTPDRSDLLASNVRVPQHVVYRAFVNETVILNLETGKYHSVNPTGATMLQELERASTVAEAAGRLAERYGRSLDEIEEDLCAFCDDLLSRSLIELDGAG
jgi:Coenzyme PQQ synthesis protein D (PqqD)